MKQLSHWAKAHPWYTRLLIIFLYIPLNIAGILIGTFLYAESIHLSSIWISVAMVSTLFSIVAYPKRKVPSFFSSYSRRKSLDALLAVSTLAFVITGSNRLSFQYHSLKTPIPLTSPVQAAASIPVNLSSSFPDERTTKPIIKSKKSGLIKNFIKKVVRFYLKRTESERILLLILTVIGAALAIYFLAALACSIACGGAEALAWAVFIGGLSLIIWLAAVAFQAINKKYNRNKRAAPNPPPTHPST